MATRKALTVKDAVSQDIIRKHWQPKLKTFKWSADGCGDQLFATGRGALGAYLERQVRIMMLPPVPVPYVGSLDEQLENESFLEGGH